MIRPSERFLAALAVGEATEFEDQYMRMSPQFEVAVGQYAWLCENLSSGAVDSSVQTDAYELYRVL